MDRNLILAVILSTIVLSAYWYFVPTKSTDPATASAGSLDSTPASNAASNQTVNSAGKADLNKNSDLAGNIIKLETKNLIVEFNTKGASVANLYLKNYPYGTNRPIIFYKKIWNWVTGNQNNKEVNPDPSRLVNMIAANNPLAGRVYEFNANNDDAGLNYKTDGFNSSNNTIEFKANSGLGYEIVKKYTLDDDLFVLNIDIQLNNKTSKPISIEPSFNLGSGNELITTYYHPQPNVFMTLIDDKYKKNKISDLQDKYSFSNSAWYAISDVYFTTGFKANDNKSWKADVVAQPITIENSTHYNPLTWVKKDPTILPADNTWHDSIKLFTGPKDINLLEKFDTSFSETLDLFFNLIARPMLITLRWLHSIVQNWGFSIMLLTVIVRLILFPLAFIGMRAMKNMSKLNPRVQAIRKKYANDKKQLNLEIIQLYRRNRVSPLAGCLPLLAQIPIFIALYWTLLPAVELRQQPFLGWLHDLSDYDPYIILPLLMGMTMFIQQRITPTPANLDPMQQKIMRFLPLIMTLFFFNFPAGLVLYWVTSNTITILQQLVFNRIKVREVID